MNTPPLPVPSETAVSPTRIDKRISWTISFEGKEKRNYRWIRWFDPQLTLVTQDDGGDDEGDGRNGQGAGPDGHLFRVIAARGKLKINAKSISVSCWLCNTLLHLTEFYAALS